MSLRPRWSTKLKPGYGFSILIQPVYRPNLKIQDSAGKQKDGN